MSKPRYFTGNYVRKVQPPPVKHRHKSANMDTMPVKISCLFQDLVYVFADNYLIVISILLVLFLSFLLPNMRTEMPTSKGLKPLKNIFDNYPYIVQQAEVACMATASDLRSIKTSLHDLTTQTLKNTATEDSSDESIRESQSDPIETDKKPGFFRKVLTPPKKPSNKEVTLMSYLYTDSFDSKNETK